jgi:hypothetical protein
VKAPARRTVSLPPAPARTPRWLLVGPAGLAAGVFAALVPWSFGVIWPDEIYQTVEQAHRVVFGFGFVPWEFHDGFRSWLGPALFVVPLGLAKVLGLRSGVAVASAVKVLLVALAAATIYFTCRLADRLGGRDATVVAAVLVLTSPMLLIFGLHPFTEVLVLPLVVGALVAARGHDRRSPIVAGVVLGAAVALRVQVAVIVPVLLGFFAWRGRRDAIRFGGGLVAPVVVAGAVDWATWGYPFASYYRYLKFNISAQHKLLSSTGTAILNREPASFYVVHLWRTLGPVVFLVLLVGFVLGARLARLEAATVVVYVLAHQVTPHKELRFMLPIMPVLIVVSSIGCVVAFRRWVPAPAPTAERRRGPPSRRSPHSTPARKTAVGATAVGVLLLVIAGSAGIWAAAGTTVADVGQLQMASYGHSIWGLRQPADVLLSDAGTMPDICGIAIQGLIYAGGYSYFDRDVNFYDTTQLSVGSGGSLPPQINALIASSALTQTAPFVRVRTDGGLSLYVRPGSCAPPPAGYTRTFPGPNAVR